VILLKWLHLNHPPQTGGPLIRYFLPRLVTYHPNIVCAIGLTYFDPAILPAKLVRLLSVRRQSSKRYGCQSRSGVAKFHVQTPSTGEWRFGNESWTNAWFNIKPAFSPRPVTGFV